MASVLRAPCRLAPRPQPHDRVLREANHSLALDHSAEKQRPKKRRKTRPRRTSDIENQSPGENASWSSSSSFVTPDLAPHHTVYACAMTPPPEPQLLTPPRDAQANGADFGVHIEEWEWRHEQEATYRVQPCLVLLQHRELSARMRSVLLDWLGQVCCEHYLQAETYLLAASYVDRYLAARPNIRRDRLQLVGVTALYVAAKLQEVHAPDIDELAELTAGACTVEQMRQEEVLMLEALRWHLKSPTTCSWMTACLQQMQPATGPGQAADPDRFDLPPYLQVVHRRCQVLLTAATLHLDSNSHAPSALACAALRLMGVKDAPAQKMLGVEADQAMLWLTPLHHLLLAAPGAYNIANTVPVDGMRSLLRHIHVDGALNMVLEAYAPRE